jgi:voltage-gated potassium channel
LKALRRIRYLAIAIAVFTAFGTIGYHLIEGWPVFDALYMTVITFSTVGYHEVHPLSHKGQVFTIFVIVFGVGLVYFAIATLSALLLEFELNKLFGRRRMERELERISDHYIICGAGRVGRSTGRELARNKVPFLVIEAQERRAEERTGSWLTIIGDATQEKVLRGAHIERARGIVAATTTDATNIYIVLTARALNPKLKIIARASEEAAEKHLKTAGADVVVSPYGFAGHRIAQSFLRPNVVDFLDIAVSRDLHEEFVIEEVEIRGQSKLAGKTIGSSAIHRDLGIMILAIRRSDGQPRFNPTASEPIMAGDHLIVMGEAAKLSELEAVASASA